MIWDNTTNPLLPVALATVGVVIVWRNVSSPGALVVGIGLVIVALIGLVRSTITVDRKQGTVTVKRGFMGVGVSARYPLHCVKGVDIKWSKFGDVLVMRVVEGRNVRDVRVAGPTRAHLGPIVQEYRQYIACV
jgi:hypothetical protein